MSAAIQMRCPTCAQLMQTQVSKDYLRNTAEDRTAHLHIEVRPPVEVQCVNNPSHKWKLSGELLLEPTR